jgi:hypothetical protein
MNIELSFPRPDLATNQAAASFKISNIICCQRRARVFFVIFFLLYGFASYFSSPPSVFLWQRERFVDICAFSHAFPPHAKTLLPWLLVF